MSKHVIEDARRCLQCRTPMCTKGCPVATPIREAIHLLLESRIAEAGQLLFENNPLSLVCCHVCPQENQCEGHCVLGRKGSPVQISAIEEYISDYYLNIHKPHVSTGERGRVAVVGSGPAGITIAFQLSQRDFDVTIFEANEQIGGILRYGIPEFRLPKRVLDRLMDQLLMSGVKIRPNTNIGTTLTVDDLFRDGYQAIVLGTGVWRPHRMNKKGESLGHVHYAIEYLRNPSVYRLGKTVAVIGAGNVAMDVARTAYRNGAEEVYVVARRGEAHVAARDIELEFAKIDGANFLFYKDPVEFVVEGVILVDTRLEEDGEAKQRVVPIPGTESLLEVDSAIIAIGQLPSNVILSTTKGINVTDRGLVAVDEFGRTSRNGIFASGDVVTGAKTVVEAVSFSKKVAAAIEEYIDGLN